jgi:hypothetical protein
VVEFVTVLSVSENERVGPGDALFVAYSAFGSDDRSGYMLGTAVEVGEVANWYPPRRQ